MKQLMQNLKIPGEGSIAVGTAGGTLCSVMGTISAGTVIETAVLAAVGATVSFVLSVMLRWLARKMKK